MQPKPAKLAMLTALLVVPLDVLLVQQATINQQQINHAQMLVRQIVLFAVAERYVQHVRQAFSMTLQSAHLHAKDAVQVVQPVQVGLPVQFAKQDFILLRLPVFNAQIIVILVVQLDALLVLLSIPLSLMPLIQILSPVSHVQISVKFAKIINNVSVIAVLIIFHSIPL